MEDGHILRLECLKLAVSLIATGNENYKGEDAESVAAELFEFLKISQKPSGMKLDAKFYGEIRKAKDDSVVPGDQYMVFLIKDNAFPATLAFYRRECERLGADDEHLASIERTRARMEQWRAEHPELCKIPDAKGEKLLG